MVIIYFFSKFELFFLKGDKIGVQLFSRLKEEKKKMCFYFDY